MALRNQPYIPLYVQDYLTDEKLNLCSASAQGVYIKIMCIMHKSEEYGKILLKQKDKQNSKRIENFASKLAKLLPFTFDIIKSALNELIDEEVLFIENDALCQKRMIKDEKLSLLRSEAGRKGGKKTQKFAKAKTQANYEYESEDEYEDINKDIIKLWIRTFGRNPKPMEAKETLMHIDKWGIDKVTNIYQNAVKKNFRSIFTLSQQLNEDGSIKEKNNGTDKPKTFRGKGAIDPNVFAEELATIKKRDS